MTTKARLESDRTELERFVDAAFRYADDGSAAVLRTFAEGSNEVLTSVRVQLNGAGLDVREKGGERFRRLQGRAEHRPWLL